MSDDWRKLLSRSILHPGDLPTTLISDADRLAGVIGAFPMKVNPYVLSVIQGAGDPIARQVLPHPDELADADRSLDPLAEECQSPAPQVIHRYPHRVVLLVSDQCAVHCRFCMRKRRVAGGGQVSSEAVHQGLQYIRERSDINEVILSGGDPLMLGDRSLIAILKAVRAIAHIRVLRIHTRMPSVLPQRVTPSLAGQLAAFQPLYINIHFNHPAELTPAAISACRRLADAGIALGSQTVLLKGINDTPEVLHRLLDTLLANRVRPYYIHQVDPVPGTSHFRVPLNEGLRIMNALRGKLSGLAMPHFMVDLPGGGGKTALLPECVEERGHPQWRIRNWQGELFKYPCH
ncbi:MAG: lysine 2,3-aminomutase [Desulfatitalea sp. BRH_c12]|nr:MAG: lysine 2,3-aminomutase [Desulfatitalea sp. BRH_c12]